LALAHLEVAMLKLIRNLIVLRQAWRLLRRRR
jgi:hypothetical protein